MSSMQWAASSSWVGGVQVARGDDDVGIHVVPIFVNDAFCIHVASSFTISLRVGDVAGDCAGRRDGGACQVDFRLHMAHAAHKVAVGGGNARARPRPECPYGRPGRGRRWACETTAARLDKDLRAGPPCMHCMIDVLRGGDDDAAHALGHLAALEDLRGGAQVVDAAVGAGADDDLVDLDVICTSSMVWVFSGRCGKATVGSQRGQRSMSMTALVLARPGRPRYDRTCALARGPCRYAAVTSSTGKMPFLAPASMAMLADAQAVVHGQVFDALAGELHGLVQRAVHADLADDDAGSRPCR